MLYLRKGITTQLLSGSRYVHAKRYEVGVDGVFIGYLVGCRLDHHRLPSAWGWRPISEGTYFPSRGELPNRVYALEALLRFNLAQQTAERIAS